MASILQIFPNMALRPGNDFARDGAEAAHHRQVRAARARIDDGTFGLCITCARPIERDRLDAAPLTERCGPCSATRLDLRRPR
jgi:RNA polymerase-binding transcription factor DksA